MEKQQLATQSNSEKHVLERDAEVVAKDKNKLKSAEQLLEDPPVAEVQPVVLVSNLYAGATPKVKPQRPRKNLQKTTGQTISLNETLFMT